MKHKIVFITLYDMICTGPRLLSSLIKEGGLEPHLILLKEEKNYVPLFKAKDEYQTYQYYYNGLLRGSHYAVDPITDTEVQLLIDTLSKLSPSLICLSTRSFAYNLCKDIFPIIRARFPRVPFVAGGWGPSLDPEKFLEFCDYVCFGEGEKTVVNICEALKNHTNLKQIPNMIYRQNGELIRNAVEKPLSVEKLNKFPLPDFSVENKYLISNNKLRHGKDFYNNRVYDCFSARGCPFSCSYCLNGRYSHIYKKYTGETCPKYRLRDIDVILREVKLAKNRGAEFIRFKDDVFPFSKEWLKEFIVRYHREINLPFFCFLRPEFHDVNTIYKLKRAGLCLSMIGVQSGAQKIRKMYKRELPKAGVRDFAKTFTKVGVQFSYLFIFRNPFEREHHLSEALNFVFTLPYASAFIFKLEPLPGSAIKSMIDRYQPTPLPSHVADWYAILQSMALKNRLLRKASKFIYKRKLFMRTPFILGTFFIPYIIKERYNILKNKYFLKGNLLFSHKTKK